MVKDMATCDVNLVQKALGIQQTGPRTVIVPADPIIWSASTSYEYLTLVASTDFGQGYISKRDVPAGTPLTDTDYWIPAAQYNAQLAQIQRDVSSIKADVSELSGTTIPNMRTELNGEINDVFTVTSDAHAVAFGDSITRGFGTSPIKPWVSYTCDAIGCTLHNYAVDGAKFTSGGIAAQVKTAKADTGYDHGSVRYAFVGAGINDHGHNATDINAGVVATLNAIRAEFPNAKIVAVPCLCASKPLNYIDQGDQQYVHIPAVSAVIDSLITNIKGNMCVMAEAPLLLKGLSGVSADNVHPNTYGAYLIGRTVYSWLSTGTSFKGIVQATIPGTDNVQVLSSIVTSNGYAYTVEYHIKATAEIAANTPISNTSDWLLTNYNGVYTTIAVNSTDTYPIIIMGGKMLARKRIPINTELYISFTRPCGI